MYMLGEKNCFSLVPILKLVFYLVDLDYINRDGQ